MPKKQKKEKNIVKVRTPVGRLSYPYVATIDSGKEFSEDLYKTDLLIPKETWKSDADAKNLRAAVLKVGRKHFKDDSLEITDFANPFRDTDKMKKYSGDKDIKGHILIRAKSEFPPVIIDAQKKEIPEKEAKQIKGGDYARLIVVVYPYSQGEGGVTLGLNLVQYYKEGPALGGGRAALIEMVDEMEVEAEDPDMDDTEEDLDDDEEDTPPARKTSAKKKAVQEDDEEEEELDDEEETEEEDSDDEGEEESDEDPEDSDESDDEDDFDFDDDEDEEEEPKKPVKKTAKAPRKKK